jgi:hypothetical protein
MRRFAVATALAVLGAAAFGAVTLYALEGRAVAVLQTTQSDGRLRRTHVWFAHDGGAVWVEAATASRPFYLDLAVHPAVTLAVRNSPFDSAATLLRGRAELVAEPGGHSRIRSLLAARYGWADRWIAMLTDTSASRAVRIVVDDAPPPAGKSG